MASKLSAKYAALKALTSYLSPTGTKWLALPLAVEDAFHLVVFRLLDTGLRLQRIRERDELRFGKVLAIFTKPPAIFSFLEAVQRERLRLSSANDLDAWLTF